MDISSGQNPAGVWSVAARTITGFDGAITVALGSASLTLANGSQASVNPPTGSIQIVTFAAGQQVNVQWTVGLNDGVTFQKGIIGGSGAQVFGTFVCTTACFMTIQNGGTVSGTYAVSIYRLNQ